MTNDQIREIFLANGFRIHVGSDDLSPYVYRAARALLEAARTIAAPAQEDNSVLRPGKAREEYLLRMLLDCFKQVGVGDGTRGWIEHADEDEILKRDTLSFEGELTFGFEAIHELIAGLKVVAFAPAQEPVAWVPRHKDGRLNMKMLTSDDAEWREQLNAGWEWVGLVLAGHAAPAVPVDIGALITEAGNASFDCGAWDDDEHPEDYPPLAEKASAAREKLSAAIASLLAAAPVVPEGFVPVPVDAYLWLMGMGKDGFERDRGGAFWWRSAFNERAGLDMMAIYEASRAPKPNA